MKICRVTTVPFVLTHHLRSQIEDLVLAGHEVHLVTSPISGFATDSEDQMCFDGVLTRYIQIPRKISIIGDFKALLQLYQYFRNNNFDVVHSVTSKAGLLCAVAARLQGVPIRLHTYVGQPWAELSGFVKWVAKASDWLIPKLNSQCYADSFSQRDFLVLNKVASHSDINVLGAGSIAGVDLGRFCIENFDSEKIRFELNLPNTALIITFIGRLTREKGITELVLAFERILNAGFGHVHLMLIGPEEENSGLSTSIKKYILDCPNIHLVGYTKTPEKYLSISDIFCLPSYREGFASVVIEAAAMGVPTVATKAVGLIDSVVDGETGLLVSLRDVAALEEGLLTLLKDPELRKKLGKTAKKRAYSIFGSKVVNELVINDYNFQYKKSCGDNNLK
jgi:glycosyltransferase involved in cell wall biosynthesis